MTDDIVFWDRIAPKYARRAVGNIPAYEATLDRVRSHLPPGARVLEAGCGTGTTALRLADSAASYTATDAAPAMIDIARRRAAGRDRPEAGTVPEFRVAGIGADGFASGDFDAVLGFNLLHLLRDLPAAIAWAHGLLKPGGLFITKTACLADMNPAIRLIVPVLRAVGKAPYVNAFRRAELEARIREGGFEIVEARAFDKAPASWFVVARKR